MRKRRKEKKGNKLMFYVSGHMNMAPLFALIMLMLSLQCFNVKGKNNVFFQLLLYLNHYFFVTIFAIIQISI